jgi:cell wall-associated NlpC family hydrolase
LSTNETQFPELDPLDRRLNAWRPDLADIRLRDKVKAGRYAVGEKARIIAPLCDLRPHPAIERSIDHQLLMGDPVVIFERREGWAWIQSLRDRYVGWTPLDGLGIEMPAPTHRVCVPRTFIYPGPDLKLPAANTLSMGAAFTPAGEEMVRGSRYAILPSGEAIFARHIRPVAECKNNYVEVARKFTRTPYLWGGASGLGLDCSGLIHLAMRMCGRDILRDSDMQAATLGEPVDPGENMINLRRGDLIFWRGHVAIVDDNGHMLHANGYSMDVTREPLMQGLGRIAQLFEKPIGYRRP